MHAPPSPETPTLLIADRHGARHFGVVAPSTTALQRALRRAAHADAPCAVPEPLVEAMAVRLLARADGR